MFLSIQLTAICFRCFRECSVELHLLVGKSSIFWTSEGKVPFGASVAHRNFSDSYLILIFLSFMFCCCTFSVLVLDEYIFILFCLILLLCAVISAIHAFLPGVDIVSFDQFRLTSSLATDWTTWHQIL